MGNRRLPMEGVRIVDLTHDWAGPHATRLLADYGAEVIKIEYVRRMDGMRGGRKEREAYNHHPRWKQINRNKLSVTLDLTNDSQRRIAENLIAHADVVVESSRPGVLDRWKLGFDRMQELKPDIILVSLSAFGQTGPDATYGGYGGGLEALSGVQVLTGYDAETRPPLRIKEIDVTNGVMGACAIMTALVYRTRTGRGQHVDVSQLEAMTSGLIGEHLLGFFDSGIQSPLRGNRHTEHAPSGCYRCAGDDKYVTLCVQTESQWVSLCQLIGHPNAALDPQFATPALRHAAHDAIDRMITHWTGGRTHEAAMACLQDRGIAAGAVLNAEEVANNVHLQARAFFAAARDGSPGNYPGPPFVLSGERPGIRRIGPRLGEHNDEVLGGMVGKLKEGEYRYGPEEIGTAFDIK